MRAPRRPSSPLRPTRLGKDARGRWCSVPRCPSFHTPCTAAYATSVVVVTSVAAALRFVLELVLLAVFGAFGFTFPSPWSWILGLGIPALVLLIWSLFIAPRAPRHLDDPALLGAELFLFADGMGALAAVG